MTKPDPLSLVGEVLDRTYRIDSLVGEGGFGVVYRAMHLGFDEPVAVKCLKIPGALSPQTREAFLRKFREEGKLLFQLSKDSLGIVRSLAVGDTVTPAGIWAPFFVLEWLDGESLAQALSVRRAQGFRGRPLAEVMRWLRQPAQALAHAHDRRVAHRDIKPANLFVLRHDGSTLPTLKVLDFGIAKVMGEGPAGNAATKTGFTSFTPQYAAPEQFDPRIGPTGPWTDVYSFALVVIEMLTDRLPVQGDDAISLMKSTLDPQVRPTPRALGLEVAEPVERVFARALSVEPGLRFADIGGFWEALETALSQAKPKTQPVLVAEPSATSPPYPQPTGMPLYTPPEFSVVGPTGMRSVPMPATAPQPPKRRVWAWILFGIVLGIAMIFVFGLLTCTTCVGSMF